MTFFMGNIKIYHHNVNDECVPEVLLTQKIKNAGMKNKKLAR